MLNIKNKYLLYIIASTFLSSLPCYSQNVFAEANNSKSSDSAGMRILQNTLSNNPESITAKITCAKVYMKNEKYAEAEELIIQILEKDPDNPKALKLLKDLNKLYSSNIQKDINEEKENKADAPIQLEPLESSDYSIEKLNKPAPKLTEEKIEKPQPIEPKQIKLPTKEEILKKARAKKQAEEKSSESSNAPVAIQAPNISNKSVHIKAEPLEPKSEDYIEPIVITPFSNEEQTASDDSLTSEKKTLKNRKNH